MTGRPALRLRLRRRLRLPLRHLGNSGVAAIELALILPVLLLLCFGTLEVAHALTAYKRVVTQTRLAARYLATRAPGKGAIEAQCLVITGTLSSTLPCAGTAVLPGLPGATITVADASNSAATKQGQLTSSATGGLRLNLVTVTVSNYRHQMILGNALGIFSGPTSASTITFAPVSATMRQVL